MSLHYLFLICKKLVPVLEMGKDGDQCDNSHIFGVFFPSSHPLLPEVNFPTLTFSPHVSVQQGELGWWHCILKKRLLHLMDTLGCLKTIILCLMRSFMRDPFRDPLLDTASSWASFSPAHLRMLATAALFFTKRTVALHNFLQFSACSASSLLGVAID